mgnify:CR=1 FL=1
MGIGGQVEQFLGATIALGHAGCVDQDHLLARQQFQQVFQRCAVARAEFFRWEQLSGNACVDGRDLLPLRRDLRAQGVVGVGEDVFVAGRHAAPPSALGMIVSVTSPASVPSSASST